jgi:hypothetical protein
MASGWHLASVATAMSAWRYKDAGRVVRSYRCDIPEVNFNRRANAAACVLKAAMGIPQMTRLRTIEPVIVSFGSLAALLLGTVAVLVALLFIT